MRLRSTAAGRNTMQQETRPVFEEGAALVLSKWTALGLAVENEWGGRNSRQKADDLIDEAIEWFYSRKEHYADDLEALLDQALSEDFSVQLEDGSAILVAKQLVQWHAECMRGDFSQLPRWRTEQQQRQQQGMPLSRPEQGTGDTADSGSSSSAEDSVEGDGSGSEGRPEDMDTDAPALDSIQQPRLQKAPPVIDDDGFQTVQRKGRR